jgi:hypothetical protein
MASVVAAVASLSFWLPGRKEHDLAGAMIWMGRRLRSAATRRHGAAAITPRADCRREPGGW